MYISRYSKGNLAKRDSNCFKLVETVLLFLFQHFKMLGSKIIGDCKGFLSVFRKKSDICLLGLSISVSLRLRITGLELGNSVHTYFIYFWFVRENRIG